MLTERDSQLLAAFVDGELGERQREAALRLVQQSPEARDLVRELEENAEKLRALPAVKLGPDFSREILQTIERLPATRLPPRRAGESIPSWIGPAIAAAVLLAVTSVSYLFFRADRQPQVASQSSKEDRLPMIAKIIEGTSEGFADLRLNVNVAELAQEKTQTRLSDELRKQNAVHLELACKNTGEAVDNLNEALETSGVKVLVDAGAKSQLKNRNTVLVVYAENLRPEELTEVLSRLGAREKMKNILDRQFASLHVDALAPEYRERVARRFGMEGKQLQPPPKDLLAKFIEAPKGKGKKTGPATPPAAKRDKFALVFANDGINPPPVSADLQKFLQAHRRQPATPGTLQIVVVVRPEPV